MFVFRPDVVWQQKGQKSEQILDLSTFKCQYLKCAARQEVTSEKLEIIKSKHQHFPEWAYASENHFTFSVE